MIYFKISLFSLFSVTYFLKKLSVVFEICRKNEHIELVAHQKQRNMFFRCTSLCGEEGEIKSNRNILHTRPYFNKVSVKFQFIQLLLLTYSYLWLQTTLIIFFSYKFSKRIQTSCHFLSSLVRIYEMLFITVNIHLTLESII